MAMQRVAWVYQTARRLAGKRVRLFLKKYSVSPYTKMRHKSAIIEKFPDLKVSSIAYVAKGKDGITYLVNKRLIFRFPRHEGALAEMKKQAALLPELKTVLPLAIPFYTYYSTTPSRTFPFPFVGYEMIEGTPMDQCPGHVFDEEWWREPLAKFMQALHSFPVERARQLGVPDKKFIGLEKPLPTWQETLKFYYEQVIQPVTFPELTDSQQNLVRREFDHFLNDPRNFEFEPVLIHNDLDSNHVFLDLDKKVIKGVIDFGESSIGDPALDVWESLLSWYAPREGDVTFPARVKFYVLLKTLETIVDGKKNANLRKVIFGLNYFNEISGRYNSSYSPA